MESDQHDTPRETAAHQQWRSCKLILDPTLTNGLYKVYRYDGQHFNVPVHDLGVFPVDAVRDPRICRLSSKCHMIDFLVPKFKHASDSRKDRRTYISLYVTVTVRCGRIRKHLRNLLQAIHLKSPDLSTGLHHVGPTKDTVLVQVNVMESDQHDTPRETAAHQQWRSCKLILDPTLTNGLYKVYRYDGQHFNVPVHDLGVFPVDAVRDPRICRLSSKCHMIDFLVPKFKIDECYVGPIPPKEVTFARLNDNVREGFLTDMCKKYGQVEVVEILYNPKNKKHLGIAKVIFDTVRAAKVAVEHLHETSVMGNIIHVEIDPNGEKRMQYVQLLLNGLYTPGTLPVGSNEETLQYLIDNLLSNKPSQRQGPNSSPTSVATPLSLDTAYSSIWQDTPGSFGLTPLSHGTPRTPCLTGTPLSQDSCYSSLQTTPVLQVEPSTFSVHRQLRRKPGWRNYKSSDLSSIFKHFQPQPLLPAHMQTASNTDHRPGSWDQNALSFKESFFYFNSPDQESTDVFTTTSKSRTLSSGSPSGLSINMKRRGSAERLAAASSPPDYLTCITDPLPSPLNADPRSPIEQEMKSLDSRIEMLLKKNVDTSEFKELGWEDCVHNQDSPVSPQSPENIVCPPASVVSLSTSQKTSHKSIEDVIPTPLSASKGDETAQAVASLLRNSQSPSPYSHVETGGLTRRVDMCQANQSPLDRDGIENGCSALSSSKELCVEHSESKQSGVRNPAKGKASLLWRPPLPFINGTIQRPPSKPPPYPIPGRSHPSVAPFTFPIPPSIPPAILPFPIRLPDGTIPIPPPGWIPPPGHPTSFNMPPPPIPPPVLRATPPLIAPPSTILPVQVFPLDRQSAGHSDMVGPSERGSVPLPLQGLAWPNLPVALFNPFVPPPGYMPVREDSHKVTVEKVLGVVVEELRSLIKKDIIRRMVEVVAFNAFDLWWECEEQKVKSAIGPLKTGIEIVEERAKLINPLSHIIGQRKNTPLPSFKVKRKTTHPSTSDVPENMSSYSEGNDVHRDSNNLDQVSDITSHTPVKTAPVGGTAPALKRRHARPLELESDGEEEEEEDNATDESSDKEENSSVIGDDTPEAQCHIVDDDQKDDTQKPEEIEDGDIFDSRTTERMHSSDTESLSEVESSSSEDSLYSDSLESYSSEGTEDSSYQNCSSTEDEDAPEDSMETRSIECVVISSDEESMELELPATPSTPLTPGAQLDLDLKEWSEKDLREAPGGGQHAVSQCDTSELDLVMEFQPSASPDHLRPPSPIGVAVVEPDFDVEMESPEWRVESLEYVEMENLRPLTPTGSLVESDPDLLVHGKPTPPVAEEMERPQTPGLGLVAQLESEYILAEHLSLSPTNSESVPSRSPSEIQVSYPAYEDIPKTPGREDRGLWTPHASLRIPATPGRALTPSEEGVMLSPSLCSHFPLPPPLSRHLYIWTPQTPGRDMNLPHRTTVRRRRMQIMPASQGGNTVSPLFCSGSPVATSSPCSLSDSSVEGVSPVVRAGPLQGLENMPGLLDEENRREIVKSTRRRERWRRRMWRLQKWSSLLRSSHSPHRPHARCRSRSEERRILHRFWRKGLDEEDARLLQVTYDWLLQQDSGFGWLSDIRWIPHPLSGVLAESSEDHSSWQRSHVSGCARAEGFYKISRMDKIRYLNNALLTTDLPSTSTQGGAVPALPQTSLRSGSDFRSEQRRLLSSFSCDSELVRFNQLKFRKKRIRFSRSHIHDWGLFAMEPIAADEMIIEYVGQTIRQVVADMREKRYEDEGIGSSYLFRIDDDIIIDATKCGNLARFINHSCNPNCYAKIITVESQKKIVIYSRQPIGINEEFTYDYKFPIEDEKIPCLCGTDTCRGSLN